MGGQISQSNSCTTTVCTYVFTLNSGQTLTPEPDVPLPRR